MVAGLFPEHLLKKTEDEKMASPLKSTRQHPGRRTLSYVPV